jgi:hypothetical protein
VTKRSFEVARRSQLREADLRGVASTVCPQNHSEARPLRIGTSIERPELIADATGHFEGNPPRQVPANADPVDQQAFQFGHVDSTRFELDLVPHDLIAQSQLADADGV